MEKKCNICKTIIQAKEEFYSLTCKRLPIGVLCKKCYKKETELNSQSNENKKED